MSRGLTHFCHGSFSASKDAEEREYIVMNILIFPNSWPVQRDFVSEKT